MLFAIGIENKNKGIGFVLDMNQKATEFHG